MIFKIVSFAGIPLIIAVTAVMVYRKLYREFPFFFSYLLVVLAGEVVRRIFLYQTPRAYFYAYWITEAAQILIAFLVLYEVFLIRLFPGFNITPIYRYLFPMIGIIVLGLTAAMFTTAPTRGPTRLAVIVGELALALNFFQVAILLFFCLLLLVMSREWLRHEFGIALGYGIYASVELITTLVRAKHYYATTSFDQLPTIAYAVAALIWLFYLSRSDPEPEETVITEQMVEDMTRIHRDIRRWFRRRRED